MSTPYQLLGDLAGASELHLEAFRRREASLVGQLEVELVLVGRRARWHLENLGHAPFYKPMDSAGTPARR